MERLDKLLTDLGVGSRSHCKKLIVSGRVRVGDEIITRPEFKLDRENHPVFVDDGPLSSEKLVYYVLHKPSGCVSATEDSRHRTVLSYIRESRKGLFPVGRLDMDTEGLLIITNDGATAHRLLSPKNKIPKTYYALLDGPLSEEEAGGLRNGILLHGDGLTSPALVSPIAGGNREAGFGVHITITEGKYHQVKRMFAAVDKKVLYLRRISFGGLNLEELGLEPGDYRELTSKERMLLDEKNTGLHF